MGEFVPTSAQTNRSVVFISSEVIEVQDLAVPKIEDDEVLVKVMSTGICGSDIHNYVAASTQKELVLGHESAGRIAAIGSKVTSRSVGQRVAIEPGFVCSKCEFCVRGQSNVCANMRYGGMDSTNGTLSQWFACKSEMTVPFPDEVSWEEAGCIQPMAITVQLARTANLRAHQTVAIFGCGPLGLMTMAVAKAYGVSKIIAFDIDEARVDFAKKYAADVGIVPPKNESGKDSLTFAKAFIAPLLKEHGLGSGVDVAIDASGSDICMQMCIVIAKPAGTYIQAGLGKQLSTVPMWLMTVKGLTIKGTVRYTHGCFADAIDLLARNKVDVSSLITAKYPMTKAVEAFKSQQKKEGIKIVIMNQE